MPPVMRKGSIVSVATIALGSMWRNMIVAFETPSAPGRAHVFEVARAQELGAHHAHERGPGEERGDEHQQPETSAQDREEDDDHVERRRRPPDLDEPLEGQVRPAAEIPLDRPQRDADDRGDARHDQGEQDRQPEPVDHPRQHVALGVVGAEPVVGVGRPGRHAGFRHDRGVAIGDDRPERPARDLIVPDRLAGPSTAAIRSSGASKHSSNPPVTIRHSTSGSE